MAVHLFLSTVRITAEMRKIYDIPLKEEPYKSLNVCKGVICCWHVAFVFEEECTEEIASQGDIHCKNLKARIQKHFFLRSYV